MALMKASTRKELGTRPVRRLRDRGLIPGIIYGHGEPPVAVTLSEHDIESALAHGERLLEVDVDGQKQNVLIKAVQWDTFGQMVLHVDLCRVSLDERVEVTMQVHLRGTPAGAADGGVLNQAISEIHIECSVASIPEDIQVRVNHLNVGDSIHLGEIELDEGAKLLDDPEAVLCACNIIAEDVEAEGEEAPAEPELIGGEKEPGEGEAPEG